MIRIIGRLEAGDYTVLCLDNEVPLINFKKLKIGTELYEPETIYDMPQSIGIKQKGEFVGKEIEFIK